MKRKIKINFQNGLDFCSFKKEVFDINGVSDIFDFELSDNPDVIIFGPYGTDIPKKGNYLRVGYFCENMVPDFNSCEWALGIPREESFKKPRYRRIQWHGVDPNNLVKNLSENDIDRIINQKKEFCNFTFSNPVLYREAFFKQLSKYKKVHAPGKSMNNIGSFDNLYTGNFWERKRQFLSKYKFTIAFENYVFPGYQTEKLYDPMQANSLPIYCGDPFISEIFNTKSFINVENRDSNGRTWPVKFLEKNAQPNFKNDCNPVENNKLSQKIIRKLKKIGRSQKMKLQFRPSSFEPIIEEIIRIDSDVDHYAKMLREPWLKNNQPLTGAMMDNCWMEIFSARKP